MNDENEAVKASETVKTDKAEEAEKPSSNKFLVIGVFLLLVLIGGGSFWLGWRKQVEPESSPSPSPILTEDSAEASANPSSLASDAPAVSPSPSSLPSPLPSATPVSESMVLNSTATIDGFRSSNAGGNAGLEVRAGRNVNLVTRGFVSFDLNSLPDGAVIEKATLRLYQAQVIGDPYGVGARVMVDHLDYGSSLEHADYSIGSLSSSFVILTDSAALEWKEADVTDRVKSDLEDSRVRSQYRLHLAIENIGGDVTGDFAYFESADNSKGTGNTPELKVVFHQ